MYDLKKIDLDISLIDISPNNTVRLMLYKIR